MTEKPILYYTEASPPSRSARYVAEQIGLDIELRNVNLLEREQNQEEFKKINPAQTIPALVDNDFKLFESHAIMAYFVDKYADDDRLFDKSIRERAKLNSLLFFQAQFLFGRFRSVTESIYLYNVKAVSNDDLDRLTNSLERFEAIIAANKTRFLGGSQPTIVDFSYIPTITSYGLFVPITAEYFPKIYQWKMTMFDRFPDIEQSEINGFNIIKELFTVKLAANQAM